jgi:hypothetical protein
MSGLSRGVSLACALAVCLAGVSAGSVSCSAARSGPASLARTHPSPHLATEGVVSALTTGDRERLRALALTEEEFLVHVWPHLPVSRPERNVPFAFVWGMLQQTGEGYLRQALVRFRGEALTVDDVSFSGRASRYGHDTVHRGSTVTLRDRIGTVHHVRLFGSMVEYRGGWKVFSYVAED